MKILAIMGNQFTRSEQERERTKAIIIFSVWLGIVLILTFNHAVWRDEVRALSLALQGDNVFSMLQHLRGEGHPAIWYLLLRGAHTLLPRPEVLQLTSLVIASATILLLVKRSPFSWPLVILISASYFALFEYSVVARNYGISALVTFSIVSLYDKYRDRSSLLLGILLFVLANCNAHSVLLVGAFLGFWLIEVLGEKGFRWSRSLNVFLLNAGVAACGVLICFLTIYPPFNDAATIHVASGSAPLLLVKALLHPAGQLDDLLLNDLLFLPVMLPYEGWTRPLHWLMSLIFFGSTLALVQRPSAMIATLVALAAFSAFFVFVHPGGYRHEALWLVFLLGMYWLVHTRPDLKLRPSLNALAAKASKVGMMCLIIILVLQLPRSFVQILDVVRDRPYSRSRDLSELIGKFPDLQRAIIVADPDFLLEPLPYYVDNPTYLMREQRFGTVVKFTKNARLSLSLNNFLFEAKELETATKCPVLILMRRTLDPAHPARVIKEGYNWEFTTTPDDVRAFLAATQLIERFAPAKTDESFDVYLLKRNQSLSEECSSAEWLIRK